MLIFVSQFFSPCLLKLSVFLFSACGGYQGIPEALMKAGAVYKYDLSIPVEKIDTLVEAMRERLGW